jgi:hypothetical protein
MKNQWRVKVFVPRKRQKIILRCGMRKYLWKKRNLKHDWGGE